MTPIEADQVSRVLLGDAIAARRLAVDHGPLVLSLCSYLADDPEQEFVRTWVAIVAELASWSGDPPLDRWMAGVAHLRFVNAYGRGARGLVVSLGSRGPRRGEPPRGPINQETVAKALSELPHERRRVVIFSHVAGMPATRIAATEGVHVDKILARLHQARGYVARQLRGDLPPWDELSQLVDGGLSATEREELEARVVSEPDMAAAWEDMKTLCAVLDSPRRAELPTALLDELIVVPAQEPEPPVSHWPWMVALLAVVAGLTIALVPPDPVVGSLGSGTHELAGRALVSAGSSQVDLNGSARIEVAEDGAIHVEVLEGRATLVGPGGRKLIVNAGSSRSLDGAGGD
ncbi:MAG: hypothetical protein GY898_27860 [Proteobacteria bacterium]|nr:hypothetical protein [Pseudomonadota bacterium]